MTQIEIHSQSFNFATGETTTTKRAREMTPQEKETIMHETIARASLVAFAEFIGQPLDVDATIRQARGLYGREGKKIAVVVKIPIDKTKPITANTVDSFGVSDGVTFDNDTVTLSYWPISDSSSAKSLRIATGGMLLFAKDATERLATERTKPTPPPPKPEPIPFEAECRAHVKTLNAQLGINLNEDAVLAAGEVARATPRQTAEDFKYILQIVKKTRAASLHVARKAPLGSDGLLVKVVEKVPCANGLEYALESFVELIPTIRSQLTPPAPTKPVLTVDSIRPSVTALDRALAARQRPFFVFGDNTSTNIDTDCRLFLDLLGGTVERLYLTFQSHSQRQTMHDTVPRVHVHTEPMFFPSEFNTTISAPIDPANPAAALTALDDRIRNENL